MALSDIFPKDTTEEATFAAKAVAPYVWTPRFKTFVSGPFNNENIVTRAGIQFPLHSAQIHVVTQTWPALAKTIFDFFSARKGRFDFFTFYDLNGWDSSPVGILWINQYVGLGTGAQLIFDLPLRNANNDASRKIYCGGVDKTANGSWAQGTGTGGRDRFTFSTYTPTAGEVVTCAGLARRVWKAVFADDTIALSYAGSSMYDFTFGLAEIP